MPPTEWERRPEGGREIEWQLATQDLAPVKAWLLTHRNLDDLRIEPQSPQRLRDTYFDTADWRILRAGYALRVRETETRAETTLKSLSSARPDLADRQEITEALPAGRLEPSGTPGSVGAWIRGTIGTTVLRPLFIAQTLRERFGASGSEGTAAEIALDDTRLLSPLDSPLGRLLCVEVEVRDGPAETLAPLVATLARSCALKPATENKFAAGLRAAALTPEIE